MARVLVAGMAVADFIFQVDEMPSLAQKYRALNAEFAGGGCAANAAVAISRQGGEALLAARLGDDPVGDLILADLEAEGVDTRLVHRAPGGMSSFSSIYVDRQGERQVMNFRGRGLTESVEWLSGLHGAGAVLADNRWPALTRTVLALARAQGIPGVVDAEAPVTAGNLSGASHIAFSMQGLSDLAPGAAAADALRFARGQTDAWVCVTDGANGVLFLDGDTAAHVPAIPIRPVDTLAAGDIWHGAFALLLAEGASERDAIIHASATATLKCLAFGGRKGCPDRAATGIFLKENEQCT
ncbi:PfkB family carbohydrate kinase [Zhengella sp. ZM62]|uniref:PfkB family carbohydrate kinase n=1 Tax=Zhengella sedimenti TaxID=3390035 RepID=UPI00397475C0